MKISVRSALTCLAVTIALLSASVAHAQNKAPDGAILISQSTVIGGLPGDTNGFPITISQPGSYRLASNIVVPNANTTAIEITASHVTLDFGGFAILGPTVCVGNPTVTSCSPTGNGSGVFAGEGTVNVTVRNGTVNGMGNSGIDLTGLNGRVERIHATNNGEDGISVRYGGVADSAASLNGSAGISMFAGTLLGNTVIFNRTQGFVVGGTVGAANNVSNQNGNETMGATQTDGNVCGVAGLCP